MSATAIQVENISKLYQIGNAKTGSLKETLAGTFSFLNKKKQPSTEDFWALQGINFEIRQGEAMGIIGKNGAGKSTLLKILSRITEPTSGRIEINGRVSSLLEVGTGFHPELSGRENIFLNGTILGMSRREIKAKFDEIVDFSGVEKFIDTPVKFYSSGMYVRLAFAVAAHLEPEILIIDEVLAVGDAEFQKKCLGKMSEVAGQGRTVIFVSHNMNAIQSLCNKGLYLKDGKVDYNGNISEAVHKYLRTELSQKTKVYWSDTENGDEVATLKMARLIDENYNDIEYVMVGKKIGIEYEYTIKKEGYKPIPNLHFFTSKGDYAFIVGEDPQSHHGKVGTHRVIAWLPKHLLNTESYFVNIALSTLTPVIVHFNVTEALIFEVTEDINQRVNDFVNEWPGIIRPKFEWQSSFEL